MVAGIKKSYTKEQLLGRHIIMINNLEPAVIRGQTSQGMLLAASDLELLEIAARLLFAVLAHREVGLDRAVIRLTFADFSEVVELEAAAKLTLEGASTTGIANDGLQRHRCGIGGPRGL